MKIREQILALGYMADDAMGMEPGDRQELAEIADTLERLNAVYEAARIAYNTLAEMEGNPKGQPELHDAIAAVQEIDDA